MLWGTSDLHRKKVAFLTVLRGFVANRSDTLVRWRHQNRADMSFAMLLCRHHRFMPTGIAGWTPTCQLAAATQE
jgi:hypothetical protein